VPGWPADPAVQRWTELAEKTGLDPALMERLKSLGYAGFSGSGQSNHYDRGCQIPKTHPGVRVISEAMRRASMATILGRRELNLALKTEPDSVPVRYLLGLNYYRMAPVFQRCGATRACVQLSQSTRWGLSLGRVMRALATSTMRFQALRGRWNWTLPIFPRLTIGVVYTRSK